jgi:Holliday junction resolvase-like predicted endonuclease
MPHLSKLPKIKKGMLAEQIAIQFLLKEGYFVFKNLYGVGPADLIAINEKGKVQIFDVKSESYRNTWKPGTRIPRALTLEQRKLKMKFIFVDKKGECRVAKS